MTLVNDERAAAEAVGAPVTDRPPAHRIGRAGRDEATRLAASLAAASTTTGCFAGSVQTTAGAVRCFRTSSTCSWPRT